MDLKEFTKQTLVQIVEGAAEANKALGKHNAFIPDTNMYNKNECYYAVDDDKVQRKVISVDFDVAITATESEGANGGASLKVASLLCLGGETENKTENQTISRVKYTLPLVLAKK
ncbi:MAG: hypothetical protein IJA57_00355 [Alistipes sp.]|nr:hypothetical protein [Alistipes sp.]